MCHDVMSSSTDTPSDPTCAAQIHGTGLTPGPLVTTSHVNPDLKDKEGAVRLATLTYRFETTMAPGVAEAETSRSEQRSQCQPPVFVWAKQMKASK